jgi:DNA-binding PadR family transcriptional regulator
MTGAQADLGPVETDIEAGIDRTDLSSAFGDSAVGALRGLLAPRRAPVQAVDDPDDEPAPEPPTTGEPSVPDARRPTEPAETPEPRSTRPPRQAAPRRAPSDGAVPAQRRRERPARVRDRHDVDLLLLAVARDGVASGREFIALVRERSGGAVELTESRVYHELHRLRNNRLIADTGRGRRDRFVLTESGERILVSRTRQWQAYARAMDRVLGD